MFNDVFSDVHVIHMRCSILYLVLFYGVFSNVHLLYMFYSIVYYRIFEKYTCDVLFKFSLLCVLIFFLMLLLYFLFFIYVMYIIYFYAYYINIVNLKLEYRSSKSRTFFTKTEHCSLNLEHRLYSVKENVLS
jgi:hypothetical protein